MDIMKSLFLRVFQLPLTINIREGTSDTTGLQTIDIPECYVQKPRSQKFPPIKRQPQKTEKRKTKKQGEPIHKFFEKKGKYQLSSFSLSYQLSASASDPDDPEVPHTKDTESKNNSKINHDPKYVTDDSARTRS